MADELYYDPYDFDIDADPYPIWKRLRDEAPLYYNEKYDFYAVSRFDDVSRVLGDRETFISGKGGVYNIITAGIEITRRLDPDGHMVWRRPDRGDLEVTLERIGDGAGTPRNTFAPFQPRPGAA
jgi:cytochrome P450